MKILTWTGVQELVDQIKGYVTGGFVAKNGTDRLMTAAEGTKLSGIAEGAQVNVIETVQVNGSPLTPFAKTVNIDLSTYALKSDVTGAMKIKGTVDNYEALPDSPAEGDAYQVTAADPTHDIEAGEIVLWNGTDWVDMGGTIDLSAYLTKVEAGTLYAPISHTHTIANITDAESWLTGKGYQTVAGLDTAVDGLGYLKSADLAGYQKTSELDTAVGGLGYMKTTAADAKYQTIDGMSAYVQTSDLEEITETEIQGLFA